MLDGAIHQLQQWIQQRGDEAGKAIFAGLETEWDKLLTLVEDAADASLFHLGKVPVQKPQVFSLKSTLHELCRELMDRRLVPRGVTSILALGHGDAAGVPWSTSLEQVNWGGQEHVDNVRGDRTKIVRVLRLLLAMALERTSAGTVKLAVTCWPGTESRKPHFSFSVSDTGRQVDKAWINERFHSYSLHRTAGPTGSIACDLNIEGDTSGCDLGLFVGYHLVQVSLLLVTIAFTTSHYCLYY